MNGVMLNPLTDEQNAWTEQQPVVGKPCMARLAVSLAAAGLTPIDLLVSDDGESIKFKLARTEAVRRLDKEQTLRLLITGFRYAGFNVGFTEMGIVDFDEQTLFGVTLCGPLVEICEQGGVQVGP